MVQYLSLNLKSPIIVGSSSLTSNYKSIKAFADAGAGAVVLKSVFEEQILSEADSLSGMNDYSEAYDYLSTYIKKGDLDNYTTLIAECKKSLDIAIIASVNCNSDGDWIDYCKQMEAAGADAIELNIYLMPTSKNESSSSLEAHYLTIAEKVVSAVGIPVSVKLSPRFTNHIYIVNELYKRGVKGVTLFNRFWEPDIDINSLSFKGAAVLSNPSEMRSNLRLISQISSEVSTIDISASTGVYSGEDALKFILSGASTVQLCSLLYKNGAEAIKLINEFVESWMKNNEFTTFDQIKGRMLSSDDIIHLSRAQFMKQFGEYK